MKSLKDQLECLRGILSHQKGVYPRWVARGQMDAATAQHKMQCLEAACASIEKLVMLQEVSEEMKKPR
jgi:hypothetical protein